MYVWYVSYVPRSAQTAATLWVLVMAVVAWTAWDTGAYPAPAHLVSASFRAIARFCATSVSSKGFS